MIRTEQLDRMPEAHPVRPHYPVDHRAARLAGPRQCQRFFFGLITVVVAERKPDQVRSMARELNASCFGEPLQGDLLFQPLDHFIGDAGHPASFPAYPAKTCQEGRTRFREPS